MALTAADKRTIAALIAQAFAAQASVPTGAPAVVAAASPVHVGPSGKPDGRIYPCTVAKSDTDGPCGRLLRSPGRAAVHAVGAALTTAGHQPA